MATKLLPKNAAKFLKESTPIYLNLSLRYGKKSCPVDAQSMCYHPVGGKEWLRRNGLSVEKEGCVEIGSSINYITSRDLWGPGGVLLHELSHAFHNKFCVAGYDCEEVSEVIQSAATSREMI
jgi:hypothetical protein